MVMMTMMSTVTSETSVAPRPVVPTTVLVTVPTTQAAVQTTPCVPTNCPARYRLLSDQTASPNCYFFSEDNKKIWSDALKACTSTPGAYLWRPNTRTEANAVKDTFGFQTTQSIWTGANSPTHDENYVFAVDNAAFSLTNLPFGEKTISFSGQDCVEILLNDSDVWKWENEDCKDAERFICELPRKTCP
ncbi:lectin BRA-3-like [Mytilus californianus]|uniref:lectin BRA-3-like n=1 Tax=Mytilus californianus TaxID=6549 RepID=UPI002247AB33|nr:lectin BRA-3-like [Mytilus californianus]